MHIHKYAVKCGRWAVDTFGFKAFKSKEERCHRFLEEAVELCQAVGTTKEEALMLVDYVYDREVGQIHQEVGGVMVTLAIMAEAINVDLSAAALQELTRISAPEVQDKIRKKQASKPVSSPLPGPTEPEIVDAEPEQAFHPQNLPDQCCFKCRHFGDNPPDGAMHGVTTSSRRCGIGRLSDGIKPWRKPSDWCDNFASKENH